MSIEQTLERIAIALEKQVSLMIPLGTTISVPSVIVTPKIVKEKGAPKNIPVVEKELPEDDPFAEVVKSPEITFDTLKEVLTLHAKSFGTKTTVTLMIKHGADSTTPKIASIPQVNYKACLEEALADLKKVEKK